MNSQSPRWILGVFALVLAFALPAQAPKEVPVAEEPRHHFAFENDVIRAFRVEVAPHDQTLLHRHDRDYFFISIGAAELTNAVLGRPEVSLQMADEQIGFTRGGFAHVAVNRGAAPFRNFTIEFKRPQAQLSNRCAKVDPAAALNCPTLEAGGSAVVPEFETEQIRVALLRIQPSGKLPLEEPGLARLLMPIGEIDAQIESGNKRTTITTGKETWLAGSPGLTVVNRGASAARLLSIAVREGSKP